MGIIENAKKIVDQSEHLTIAYIREDGYPRASTIGKMKNEGLKTIYMSTAMDALKTKRIQQNEKVSLCIRDGWDNITLTGRVAVTQDNDLRKSLWQDWCIDHFHDGATGERFCIFIFETEEAEFWVGGESGAFKRDEL